MLILDKITLECKGLDKNCQTLYPIICALAGGNRDNAACERIKEVSIDITQAISFMPVELGQILKDKFPDGKVPKVKILVDPSARWNSAESFLQVLESDLMTPKKPVLILAYDGSVQEESPQKIASPQIRKKGQWILGVADHHHPKTVRSLSPTSGQQTDELLMMINEYLESVEQINIDINDIDPDVVCPITYTYIKLIWDSLSLEQKDIYKDYFASVFIKLDEVINYDGPIDRRIGVVNINDYSDDLQLNKDRLLLHRHMFESVDKMRTKTNRSLDNYVDAMTDSFNRVAEYILDPNKDFLTDSHLSPKPAWLSNALAVHYHPHIEILDIHQNHDLASATIREGNPGHRAIMVESVSQVLQSRFPENKCNKFVYAIVVNSNIINTTVVYINHKPITLVNHNWTICGDPETLNIFRYYINLLEEFFQVLFNQKTALNLEKITVQFDFTSKQSKILTSELITQVLKDVASLRLNEKGGNFCMADSQGDFGFLANHRVGSCYLTQTVMNYLLSWFTQLQPSILKLHNSSTDTSTNASYGIHQKMVDTTLAKLIYTIIERELPNLLKTSEQKALDPIATASIEKVTMH